jgi:tripartite-type tricarboxylate transporter receptor subunit TctC
MIDRHSLIRLSAAAALADPTVKTRFATLGLAVVSSPPDQLAAKLQAETDLWGPVIKAAGITSNE